MMDWTNGMVIEFLHHYETKSVIWDPRHNNHKKQHAVCEAWLKIRDNLSWYTTVEELKKKRDSLMAYYRIHMKRIKNSKVAGEDEYKTSWFAFDTMHSFLGEIYDSTIPSNNETFGEKRALKTLESTDSGCVLFDHQNLPIKRREEEFLTNIYQYDRMAVERRRKRRIECQLYGELLVQKLMKLDDDDRIVLMNDMDNLVFKRSMEAKAKAITQPCNTASAQILPSRLRIEDSETVKNETIKIEIIEDVVSIVEDDIINYL